MTDPAVLAAALARFSRRDDDALEHIDALVATGSGHPHLLLAQAELAVEYGRPQPLAQLAAAVAVNPEWVEGQRILASLRYETGEDGDFARDLRAAVTARPGSPGLWNALIATLVDAGQSAAAADCAREARALFGAPILLLIEAGHASEAGQYARADKLFAQVAGREAGRDDALARHRIRTGAVEEAADLLEGTLSVRPLDRAAWALIEPVWRALGHPRAAWLSGDPSFCRAIELPISDEERRGLVELLRGLHVLRARPLGQSARGGTQTRGALFNRAEPRIARLRGYLQDATDAYRSNLPTADPAHPLLAFRDRPLKVNGGWSIRLAGEGFHVPHIHPAGIVSSAAYFVVPDAIAGDTSGWLEIGRPPADLRLDVPPLHVFEPKPGRLVLFPSYLYHGTRPFRTGERLSVAFDASG